MKQFIILLTTVAVLTSCGSSTGEATAVDTLKTDSAACCADTVKVVDTLKVDTTTVKK
jgi:hypothetical protein